MLKDLLTVTRKELIEIVRPDGKFQGGAKNVLIILAIAGILFPLQAGPGCLTSWMSVYSACFPAIVLVNHAADTFAGERERHTLETLLASRLPDPAILLGKVAAIVAFGWALIAVGQVLAVIALSLVHGHGRLLCFAPGIALATAVVAFALPLLLTSAGALVSLTAPTVRSAGQRMLVPFVVLYGLPMLAPYLARQLSWVPNPEAIDPRLIVAVVCTLAAVVSAGLLAVALLLFERERLVLS